MLDPTLTDVQIRKSGAAWIESSCEIRSWSTQNVTPHLATNGPSCANSATTGALKSLTSKGQVCLIFLGENSQDPQV